MYITLLIIVGIGALPAFYLWAYIHEYAHITMADHLVGALETKVRVHLPPKKMDDGSWRWASCRWRPSREAIPKERAAISLAPRIPDLVAALAFPLFGLFPDLIASLWFLVMGAGVVDLIVGSIGRSTSSDLSKAARALDVSKWPFRLGAATVVLYDLIVGAHFAGLFR